MNNKIQLLSTGKHLGVEKRAMGPALIRNVGTAASKSAIRAASPGPLVGSMLDTVATSMPAIVPSAVGAANKFSMSGLMTDLAKRRDFLGGLLAPVPKLYGGLQRALGYGQRGVVGLKSEADATLKQLSKDPLFREGRKNIAQGGRLRRQSGLLKGITDKTNPWQYRVGRGLGAVAIGAPLFNLPFNAAEYLGAAAADPAVAEEYAKNRAYLHAQERLQDFANLPFLERLQTTWNPERYAQQVLQTAPEANDLYENIANQNINNPGILKYLASFNPFLGSPESVINQKIRSQMLHNLGTKQASAADFFKNILKPAFQYGRNIRLGRPTGIPYNVVKPSFKNLPWWQNYAGKIAQRAGKHPVITGLAGLGSIAIPYGIYDSYQSGKQNVYDSAANNAIGLADLGLMEKFNQPGFMSGLGRLGMAVAPGMGSDMILKQIRQSMFPESYISE